MIMIDGRKYKDILEWVRDDETIDEYELERAKQKSRDEIIFMTFATLAITFYFAILTFGSWWPV